MKSPKQVVTEWTAAFNNRDPAAVAALYHDEAMNIQVALGEAIQGSGDTNSRQCVLCLSQYHKLFLAPVKRYGDDPQRN